MTKTEKAKRIRKDIEILRSTENGVVKEKLSDNVLKWWHNSINHKIGSLQEELEKL